MFVNPMILKLTHANHLSDEDRARLAEVSESTREVKPEQCLIREGEDPRHVRLVLSGWAYRHKDLSNGRRSIMAYLVPGDFCDLHVAILGRMDHSISALTTCTIADIPHRTIDSLTRQHPSIARAFWWATLVDESVLREWLVNIGQRSAAQRLAHFLCEMHLRLLAVGCAEPHSFDLPLTQEKLGETLGLSTVHMNRTVQELRRRNTISLEGKSIVIPNVSALQRLADFDQGYLHLGGKTRKLDFEQTEAAGRRPSGA